jgi:hypothetical protein
MVSVLHTSQSQLLPWYVHDGDHRALLVWGMLEGPGCMCSYIYNACMCAVCVFVWVCVMCELSVVCVIDDLPGPCDGTYNRV